MEVYFEGLWHRRWIIALAALLFWWSGWQFAHTQTSTYMASTTVVLNDKFITGTVFSAKPLHFTFPNDYKAVALSPALLYRIIKVYPRFTLTQLEQEIAVSSDQSRQLLVIRATDTSPVTAADIVNFLAQSFVQIQTTAITRQLLYYQRWLLHNMACLNNDIKKQYTLISTTLAPSATPIKLLSVASCSLSSGVTQQRAQDQIALDQQELYRERQTIVEIQHVASLLSSFYIIAKPADILTTSLATAAALSAPLVELLTVIAGIFLSICLICVWDTLTPVIRHQRELSWLTGTEVLAEVPQSQKNVWQHPSILPTDIYVPPIARQHMLSLLGATLAILALKSQKRTILLTSPQKRCHIAPELAVFQSSHGYKTLLIDAHLEETLEVSEPPEAYVQLSPGKSSLLETVGGHLLSCIHETSHANLFLLPATALLAEGFTNAKLLALLPELRELFDLIVLDAPPLHHAITHQLLEEATRTVICVHKRKERSRLLMEVHATCETLKVQPYYVFLA